MLRELGCDFDILKKPLISGLKIQQNKIKIFKPMFCFQISHVIPKVTINDQLVIYFICFCLCVENNLKVLLVFLFYRCTRV
jgi:hypothetical protein